MLKFTNKKRRDISYKIKDKIFLLTKNIDIIRLLKKLNYKIIESFKVIWETEDSYKLNLSELMIRKYLVFYLLLLRNTEDNLLSE